MKRIAAMRRRVGWFVVFGIGVVMLVLLIVGLRTDVFAKKFYLRFSPPSAAAFYLGQPVKFQGFTIGRVSDIELSPSGKVQVTLRLLERYRHMLHQGSVARLVKEGLIGEQVVEVTAGDAQRAVLRDGQSLDYQTAASIEQLLQDLKPAVANANTLLREAAEFARWLNDPYGEVRQVAAKLGELSQGMKREELEALVRDLAQTLASLQAIAAELKDAHVAENLGDSLKVTAKILHDLEPLSRALGEEGPETAAGINKLLTHLDRLSQSLNVVAADLSELTPELPGLARESRGAIQQIRSLIEGLRGSWLFGAKEEKQEDPVASPVLDMRP